MNTCMCAKSRPRTTYTFNPSTKQGLFLCSMHADMHRKGYGFPVATYKEDK